MSVVTPVVNLPRVWQRYGVALVASTLAAILTLALGPLLAQMPALLFLAAVLISAWYGGQGPGFFSVLLGTLFFYFLFLTPDPARQTVQDSGELAVYLLVAVLTCALTAGRKRAEAEARLEQKRL